MHTHKTTIAAKTANISIRPSELPRARLGSLPPCTANQQMLMRFPSLRGCFQILEMIQNHRVNRYFRGVFFMHHNHFESKDTGQQFSFSGCLRFSHRRIWEVYLLRLLSSSSGAAITCPETFGRQSQRNCHTAFLGLSLPISSYGLWAPGGQGPACLPSVVSPAPITLITTVVRRNSPTENTTPWLSVHSESCDHRQFQNIFVTCKLNPNPVAATPLPKPQEPRLLSVSVDSPVLDAALTESHSPQSLSTGPLPFPRRVFDSSGCQCFSPSRGWTTFCSFQWAHGSFPLLADYGGCRPAAIPLPSGQAVCGRTRRSELLAHRAARAEPSQECRTSPTATAPLHIPTTGEAGRAPVPGASSHSPQQTPSE